MELEVTGPLWFWKGPAPWHFVTVPEDASADIEAIAASVTYGWGVIPVVAHLGKTTWTTSLFPRDGLYLVPVKTAVRQSERVELGDVVTVRLTIGTG